MSNQTSSWDIWQRAPWQSRFYYCRKGIENTEDKGNDNYHQKGNQRGQQKQKFRQLPPGEQHRGMIDYEYQLVHALIGKYALDPKGLAEHITRKKPELLSAWNNLNSKVSKKKEELAKQLPPKSSKNNRPANLSMLAESAVECYIEYISGKLKYWEENAAKDPAVLRTACRKFGVRTGMPKDP